MHIGFLQTRFAATDIGGAEIHTENLARSLQNRGHKVTIHTARPPERRSGIDDLDVYEYKVPLHKNPVEEFSLAQHAWEDLTKCDVVTLTDDSAWRGVDFPVPTVMVFHFVWHGWIEKNRPLTSILTTKPQAILYRWMEKKIVSKADRIVSISPNMYKDIERIEENEEKIISISNGVGINRFRPAKEKYDQFTVHFQGRLIDLKNPDLLVEAANLSEKPWNLTIGGTGPLEDRLCDLIRTHELEERVTLLGYLDENELVERYRRSHVYALPSTYEGMPLAVLEAAASATPIIASPRAATDFVDDEIGWVVDPNPETLAKLLDRLYRSPEEVRHRGRNARERAEQYSWQEISGQYEELYNELLSDESKESKTS